MHDEPAPTERLFSYGTLRLESVQLATFGRRLDGAADVLPGFALATVEIDDPQVIATSGQAQHPIIRFTGRAGRRRERDGVFDHAGRAAACRSL